MKILKWCHRVNSRTRRRNYRSGQAEEPRPIVAKFLKWKEKEIVLKKAREIKPQGVRFLADLSSRTIQKRSDQVPKLLEARHVRVRFLADLSSRTIQKRSDQVPKLLEALKPILGHFFGNPHVSKAAGLFFLESAFVFKQRLCQ